MKTPTKQTAHRLAAILAIIIAIAASSAWARNQYWSDGSGDHKWSTASNWSGSESSNAEFRGSKFNPGSTGYVIDINGNQTASWKLYVCGVGSENTPLVFRNTAKDKTLTIGRSDNSNVTGYYIAYDEGDAWLQLECGKYTTFNHSNARWYIGSANYKGHVIVTNDATLVSIGKMFLSQGTVYVKSDGKMTLNTWCAVGALANKTGKVEIDGGEVQSTADRMTISDVDNSTGIVVIKNGGKYSNTGSSAAGITVGQVESGTLEVDNGEVNLGTRTFNVCGSDSSTASVTIKNGGIVKTKGVVYGSGTGGATITIDGGILKATAADTLIPANNRLTVTVGSNGGTIDNGSYNVTIASAIGGAGGMTFTGGGTTTLNGAITYEGATTVEVGTAVVVASTNNLGGGLVLTVPATDPGDGVYTVLSVSGDETLEGFTLPEAPENCSLRLSPDKKSLLCIYGDPQNTWIGGASGSLNDGANWLSGSVPVSGTAVIGSSAAAALTNPEGSAFAATEITVPAGSEAITISGAKFSGMSKITNNSSSMIEFENAVEFSGNVDVLQNTGIVKFTGGATGRQLARATDIHGTYTFTKTGDLTEIAGTVVKSDGVYNLPNGCFYKHNGDFSVEAGGIAVVKSTKEDGGPNSSYVNLANSIAGTFIATDEIFSGRKPEKNNLLGGTGGAYLEKSSGDGVFFANKVRVATGGLLIAPKKIAIGPGGILRGTGIVRVLNNGSHYFGSLADWTMYTDGTEDSADPILIKYSSTTSCVLTFDTRNYTNDAAQVITCKAPICVEKAATASTLSAIVKGNGTFSFECSYNDTGTPKWFSGGLTVQDTATVEVKANAKPGKGAITLGAGTTLALTATSNDAFTPLANTLNLPTTGIATLRIDGKRLRSGEGLEIATIGNAASVTKDNVKIEGDAIGGRKTTLRIEDGKLLLNIQPEGLMVIFR